MRGWQSERGSKSDQNVDGVRNETTVREQNSLIWTAGLVVVIRVRLCDRYPQFTSGNVPNFSTRGTGNFPAPVHPRFVCFVHYNPSIWYLNWTGDESRSCPQPYPYPYPYRSRCPSRIRFRPTPTRISNYTARIRRLVRRMEIFNYRMHNS